MFKVIGSRFRVHGYAFLIMAFSQKTLESSYRSRIKSGMTDPASRIPLIYWIPAFAGMTEVANK
jgi:hypothetical protein